MIRTALSATLTSVMLSLVLAAPGPACAGPKEDVIAAVDKFLAAKSYHSSVAIGPGPEIQTDFVAPDRMRMTLGTMGERITIGDTLYLTSQGKTRKQAAPDGGRIAALRNRDTFLGNTQTLKVTALGAENLGGTATRKYQVENSQLKFSSTYWIAGDGYPLQVVTVSNVSDTPYTSTLKYSRYNDPSIKIQAPAVK